MVVLLRGTVYFATFCEMKHGSFDGFDFWDSENAWGIPAIIFGLKCHIKKNQIRQAGKVILGLLVGCERHQ